MKDGYLEYDDIMANDIVQVEHMNENVYIQETNPETANRFSEKPVLMSPEFLEKNGFHIDDEITLLLNDLDIHYVVYKDETGRITVRNDYPNRQSPYDWYVHVDNEDFQSIGHLDFAYIHEFQQFLRLCGFKDFANKLKV